MAFQVGDRVRAKNCGSLNGEICEVVETPSGPWLYKIRGTETGFEDRVHEHHVEAVGASVLDRFAELAKDADMLPVLEALTKFCAVLQRQREERAVDAELEAAVREYRGDSC